METKYFIGIIIAATAILVGLALWPALSPAVGQMTKTFTNTNVSFTFPTNTTTQDLTPCGQRAISNTITNASGGEVIQAANYTISQGGGSDGYLSARIVAVGATKYQGTSANISCEYEPRGYISDGGSRAIVGLIAIFFALLIVVSALPDLRNGVIDFFKG